MKFLGVVLILIAGFLIQSCGASDCGCSAYHRANYSAKKNLELKNGMILAKTKTIKTKIKL